MALKTLCLTPETHASIKAVAVKHGVKIGALADSVLKAWVSNESFFLPKALRSGYAKARRGGKKK